MRYVLNPKWEKKIISSRGQIPYELLLSFGVCSLLSILNISHLDLLLWKQEPSWSWWYDSWIYNYLCTKCLSPLKLWVQIPLIVYSIQHYVIKFVSDLRQVGGFLRFPPTIKLTGKIKLKYCWKCRKTP